MACHDSPVSLKSAISEFTILFLLVPTFYRIALKNVFPLPFLWIFALSCFIYLRRDSNFAANQVWKAHTLREHLPKIILRFLPIAALSVLLVYWSRPDLTFLLLRSEPRTWLLVLSLYPILFVIPQNIIYRAFFFQRYSTLFSGTYSRVIASSCAFSYVHIIYGNMLSIVLTFLGGILFARTYEKTGSLCLASVEHALYDCWIFTVGLGQFFFHQG